MLLQPGQGLGKSRAHLEGKHGVRMSIPKRGNKGGYHQRQRMQSVTPTTSSLDLTNLS